jgi:hypothetical protein
MTIKTDELYQCTEAHWRKTAAGDPVFIGEGSRWLESSGIPRPGSDLWVLANAPDAEINGKKLQRADAVAEAAKSREESWSTAQEAGRLAGLRALIGH